MGRRIIEPEWLDQASEEQAQANLADIRRINRWLGGESVLRYALKGFESASILDVGAASGEIARLLPRARVVSLDLHARNLRQAPGPVVAADAFRLPFGDRSFDVVASSLFLHHFPDAQVVDLLAECARVARSCVAVADLERHWLAERFLPFTQPLFGWSDLTVHDGPVSVRAAFRADELEALARQAGLGQIRLRRHVPWFRISLVGTPEKGA